MSCGSVYRVGFEFLLFCFILSIDPYLSLCILPLFLSLQDGGEREFTILRSTRYFGEFFLIITHCYSCSCVPFLL